MPERPNFLTIMSDEHGPMWSSADGHPFVQTPSMERPADQGGEGARRLAETSAELTGGNPSGIMMVQRHSRPRAGALRGVRAKYAEVAEW